MTIIISLFIGWFLCSQFYAEEITKGKEKLKDPSTKQQLNG